MRPRTCSQFQGIAAVRSNGNPIAPAASARTSRTLHQKCSGRVQQISSGTSDLPNTVKLPAETQTVHRAVCAEPPPPNTHRHGEHKQVPSTSLD
jgi:hypothetical protein|mmetsp:Transcript_10579/g.19914  ORF Transcript_10579/g.19914 Transcript_10579/m.19914 type:complete len:94 (-) Transcript_10579:1401-1682(-)